MHRRFSVGAVAFMKRFADCIVNQKIMAVTSIRADLLKHFRRIMRRGTSLCSSQSASDISRFIQGSLRKTKTDKKDAMTIAQFLLSNEKKLCAVNASHDGQDLRDLARERESQSWIIASLKNDPKRLLQNTFPEFETLRKNIYTETTLNFLRQYPSARLIRQAKKKDIEKALICPAEKRKRVQMSAEDLINAAKRSWAQPVERRSLLSLRRQPRSCIFRKSARTLPRHW